MRCVCVCKDMHVGEGASAFVILCSKTYGVPGVFPLSVAAAWRVDHMYHFAARKTEAWGWRASGAGLTHPLLRLQMPPSRSHS